MSSLVHGLSPAVAGSVATGAVASARTARYGASRRSMRASSSGWRSDSSGTDAFATAWTKVAASRRWCERGHTLVLRMRILHLADRLTDRGGAYTWMLGIVEGLSNDHEQRLVVGEDPGEVRPGCPVVVRPGLESRVPQALALDDLVADFRPDVIHVHNVVNPLVLEWASARRGALVTVQDHRFFCPTRGKWTLAGEVCRRPLSREVCASCFEDQAYFEEVHALSE